MKKKKRKWIIPLAISGLIFLLFVTSAEYTSHSKFCSACHYMKPFYQSWSSSSHRDIECNVCHYPPGLRSKLRSKVEGLLQVGRYWTKLYLKSKPWAEISDESCLREGCHDKRLLEGQVKFKKIVFDHEIHFSDLKRGKRLRCTSCHSQIVQGEHITVTESSCFICHFKESDHYPQISDCSHCHHKEDLVSEKSSIFNHLLVFENDFACDKCHSQTIIGDGEVPRENCYRCHWETERLAKYDETDLMHSTHIYSHKIECNQCHQEIQHKIVKDIETIADCKTCHTGSHLAQKILYTGQGGKGVDHTAPNIMLKKGLSCKGCHIFHEEKGGKLLKAGTYISKAKACESCHGKGFARLLREWEVSTEKKLVETRDIYLRATLEIEKIKSSQKEKAQSLLKEAAFNMDIVERGKSVHNVAYSQELLSTSFNKLEEALRLVGSSYKPERFLVQTAKIPTQCSNCHAGLEEIPAQIFGLNFSHKTHLLVERMDCSDCHSNLRKHGEFIGSRQGCSACHHQEISKDCGICHQLQKTFYEGGNLNGTSIPKDMMAEGGVRCIDCHLDSKGRVFRSGANKCADCHDEGYKVTFTRWQASIRNLLNSLKDSQKDSKAASLTESEKVELQRIGRLLEKIELEGSLGVHNYLFLEEALTNLNKNLKSLVSDERPLK